MKLSDSFLLSNETPDVELTVKMININFGHNRDLVNKCELLDEYVRFIDILKTNLSKETDNEVAINKTIIYCLKNEILEDFLRTNRSEVLGMLLEEFDKKKYERSIREEEREEGREEGRKEAKREILFALISDGTITVEKAAEISGIDIEELNQMFK